MCVLLGILDISQASSSRGPNGDVVRGPNGDVGIEGNSGSDGKGEWSEMVWACVEEGWWARFEKSVGVWSEGQEEARMTKEDMEHTSGEEELKSVGLEKEDALNRARWREGVGEIDVKVG